MKNNVVKLHSWMERNLEKPFVRAEMVRAQASEKDDRLSAGVQYTAVAGLMALVCWMVVVVVR